MAVVPRDRYNTMKRQADASEARRQEADQELLQAIRRLKQLSGDAKDVSEEELRLVQKRFDEANRDIQQELDALREEFGKQLGKQKLESKRAIAEIARLAESNRHDLEALERGISSLERKIKAQFDELARKMQNDRKQALLYYQQLADITDQIGKLFPEKYEALYPEQLQPGFYVLKCVGVSVLEDIEAARYEAAIGLAQTKLPAAVRTLGLLGAYHAAFLEAEAQTKTAVSAIQAKARTLEEPKKTTVRAGNGAEYMDEHAISYWVRELFAEVKKRISESTERFDACVETHDTDGLATVRRDLDVLNEQLTLCEQIGAQEQTLHFEGYEQAARIYDALEENDPGYWSVTEIHTDDEDLRGPICIDIASADKYRITLTCFPVRSADLTTQGRIRSELEVFDDEGRKDDPARCEIVYKNLATILRGYGISLCQTEDEKAVTDSKTFIDSAIRIEGQARARWLSAAEKAIGLLEEI